MTPGFFLRSIEAAAYPAVFLFFSLLFGILFSFRNSCTGGDCEDGTEETESGEYGFK